MTLQCPDIEYTSQYLNDFSENLSGLLHFDSYFLYRIPEGCYFLELVSAQGVDAGQRQIMQRMEFQDTVCGKVAASRQPYVASNLQHSNAQQYERLRSLGLQTYASWPLIVHDRVMGTLAFGSRQYPCFSRQTLFLLSLACDCIAMSIERKHTKVKLRDADERFRKLIGENTKKIWETDQHGIVVIDTPVWREYTGQSIEDWIETELIDLVHPEDIEVVRNAWRHAIAEKTPNNIEFRIQDENTGWRWLNVRAAPLLREDGSIRKWVGIQCDIHERKEAEEALEQSQYRLSQIFAHTAVGLAELSPEGRFLQVNNEICRIIGRSEEETLKLRVADVMHPDDIEESAAAFKQVLEENTSIKSLDKRYTRPDGEMIWANSILTLLRNEFGQPSSVLAVVVDLTERKNNEQKLIDRLAERTRAMQKQAKHLHYLAKELASAEQRERKNLAALLHDDLQQLLFAAEMYMVQITQVMPKGPPNDALQSATRLLKQATDVTRDLSHRLRPPTLYEEGLVAALHWLAEETLRRHQLNIKITAHTKADWLQDEVKIMLFECVHELLFNVAKYADVDEATIDIYEKKIDGDNCLCLKIIDRGRGFDMKTIRHANKTTGMGLFNIRERLNALGGSMTIESKPDQGTRATIKVPANPHVAIEKILRQYDDPTPSVPNESDRTRYTDSIGDAGMVTDAEMKNHAVAMLLPTSVLVVDDHAIVREGITRILDGDHRLDVIGSVADGRQAIEAVERQQPNVILMDMNMPQMNGIDAAREIHERWPDIAIIGLSVQSDEASAQSMMRAGACAFLPKTGDSQRMIDTIIATQKYGTSS